jgi:hypothetical protein
MQCKANFDGLAGNLSASASGIAAKFQKTDGKKRALVSELRIPITRQLAVSGPTFWHFRAEVFSNARRRTLLPVSIESLK